LTEVSSDFKYIVRIADTDLNGERPLGWGITSIRGVGHRVAQAVIHQMGIDGDQKLGNLTDEQISELNDKVVSFVETAPSWLLNRQRDYDTGDDTHLVGVNVKLTLQDDINRLRKIRAYRGIRHETGQKVRGQRSKSNGRSGSAVGVSRKKIVK